MEYMLMCEKAEEIQRIWKPQTGDRIQQRHTTLNGKTESHLDPLLVVEVVDERSVIVYLPESACNKTELKMVCWTVFYKWFNDTNGWWWWVWLPRQDQLWKMLNYEYTGQFWESGHADWMYEKLPDSRYCNYSFEQLLLSLVMKEKYGKIWTGTEWKKDESGSAH